jgi:DNA-binding XRE family transcriptional regulator
VNNPPASDREEDEGMGRTVTEAIDALPPERRAKIEARAAELIAEELSLQELRKAMRLTQVELADRLGVRQDTISRLEKRADMLLSTLQSYVEAIGGRLAVVAELPNHPPVRIKQLSMLAGQTEDVGETNRPTRARDDAA